MNPACLLVCRRDPKPPRGHAYRHVNTETLRTHTRLYIAPWIKAGTVLGKPAAPGISVALLRSSSWAYFCRHFLIDKFSTRPYGFTRRGLAGFRTLEDSLIETKSRNNSNENTASLLFMRITVTNHRSVNRNKALWYLGHFVTIFDCKSCWI